MKFVIPLLLLMQQTASANLGEVSFYTKASAKREGTSGEYTASGERFHENRQTCAHPNLPFGTILKVTNPKNGIWIYCRVNDRGPSAWTKRALDLTPKGFKLLKIPQKQGIAKLDIKIKELGNGK